MQTGWRLPWKEQSTLNGLNGWFVQSAQVESGFAGDPTSLACENIYLHN